MYKVTYKVPLVFNLQNRLLIGSKGLIFDELKFSIKKMKNYYMNSA